jgi:hypothetical protein
MFLSQPARATMSSVPDHSDEYAAALARGKRLCQQLESFERLDTNEQRSIHSLYNVESDPLRRNAERNIQRALAGCGLGTSEMVFVDVSSRGNENKVAYANNFDARSGVIVCNENFRNRDKNPPEEQLWPSEILWQSYMVAVQKKGLTASALRAIVRLVVINENSQNIIWEASRRSQSTREGPNGYREYTIFDEAYFALLGSTNGGSAIRMLIDHKVDTNYRTVERVVVLEKKDLEPDKPESRSLMILLSGPRTPPIESPQPTSPSISAELDALDDQADELLEEIEELRLN